MKFPRIPVSQEAFNKNFLNNPFYPNINALQNEFDKLVEDYNRIFCLRGFCSKAQIAMDKIMLLKNKLEL